MDDLQIAWRPLGELIPYARNPRTHSDAQVAQIAASIREFGWTNPVLVDGANGIIAGHGRVLAARKLGLERVPVIELAHMSEAQKRAYVLADNQLALNAGWDEALLRLELADLSELGFDLGLIGFGAGELERLLAGEKEGLTEDDEAPALPEQAITQPGDLWLLGEHRLLCGDATVLADVERVLEGQLADMTFTDPPYNVDYANSPKDKLRGKHRPILNDNLGSGFEAFLLDACVNILSGHQGRRVCLHEQLGAAHAAASVHGRRRQMVDVRDLGQEHVHPRPRRLSTPIRADPLRLEGGARPLLVRRSRPGRRLVLRQAGPERPASDNEAGGAGRAGDPELEQEPGHRARPVRRVGLHADRLREDRPSGAPDRARPEVLRRDRPPLAGVDGRAGDVRRGRVVVRRCRCQARHCCCMSFVARGLGRIFSATDHRRRRCTEVTSKRAAPQHNARHDRQYH